MRKDLLEIKEKQVEARLVDLVKKAGGIAYKFNSINRPAVPDRLILLYGYTFFIECKAPGKKPTPAQELEHKRIRAQGVSVWVASNYDEVALILDVYFLGR